MHLVDLPVKATPQIASCEYMHSVDPPEKFINIFFINHSLAAKFFLSIKKYPKPQFASSSFFLFARKVN